MNVLAGLYHYLKAGRPGWPRGGLGLALVCIIPMDHTFWDLC